LLPAASLPLLEVTNPSVSPRQRQADPVPGRPEQVALSDAAAWVTTGGSETVQRIDLSTDRPEPIKVGNGPTGIAFGADRVWVANGQDGTGPVINPETYEERAVWVALAP
jgi:DNA-binding beta-propeller fold protein YncE